MPAAKVTITEVDRSTTVPSPGGVYGAIVIPAPRGPLTPQLVTSQSQLLSLYTPNNTVAVGYDISFYSAIAFLQKSGTLWVNRAVDSAYVSFSGAAIVRKASALSSYGKFVTTIGLNADLQTPTTYTFQQDELFLLRASSPGDWGRTVAVKVRVNVAAESFAAGALASNGVISGVTGDWQTGEAVRVNNVGGGGPSLPASLTSGGTYYVIRVSPTTVSLATSYQGAIENAVLALGDCSGRVLTLNQVQTVKETGAFIIEVYAGTPQTLVESWTVSRTPGAKDGYGNSIYIEERLLGSNYLRAADNVFWSQATLPMNAPRLLSLTLGDDGENAVGDAAMITAVSAFADVASFPVTLLLDGGWATAAYQQKLYQIAENRQDCVAVLNTPSDAEQASDYLNQIVNYRNLTLNANNSYAMMLSPHVLIQDSFNNRQLYIPNDGFQAGVIAETARLFEIWYPPAGPRRAILNVMDVYRRFTDGELDFLADNGINPIRFRPGKGIVIWGQKTLLNRPSALSRANVRLLLITIEPAIKTALDDFEFELNDDITRAQVTSLLNRYLANVKARRGLYDYRVQCDEDNNTGQDIDNYTMNVWCFIQPVKGVEFIPVKMILTPTGVSFSQSQIQA